MPRFNTSLQRAAHYTRLRRQNSPEGTWLSEMIARFEARRDELNNDLNVDEEKIGLMIELCSKLDSINSSIQEGAEFLFNNNTEAAFSTIKNTADTIRSFENTYEWYIRKFPEEQDEDYHKSYRQTWELPTNQADALLAGSGETKTATAWIDQAKAELNNDSYEPEYHLARIIAARQLANAERGRRRNIDTAQLTEGQLENRTWQLLEDPTFRSFLKSEYLPRLSVDPTRSNINPADENDPVFQLEAQGKARYLGLLSQGHGGAFEDKLDAFIKRQDDHQLLDQGLYGRYQEPVFDARVCTQEFRPRSEGLPAGQREIQPNEVRPLSVRIRDFAAGISLYPDENGKIPPQSNGMPTLFTIREGAGGNMEIMSLDEAGLQAGTIEYLKALQKGEIYAYPPGDLRPVQVQLNVPENRPASAASIAFSKPLTPEQLCPYPEPSKPSFITSLFSLVSNRAKTRINDYNNAKTKRDTFLKTLRNQENSRTKAGTDERRLLGERKAQEKKEKRLKNAQTQLDHLDLGKDRFLSIYKPVPEYREDLARQHVYDQNSFARLRPVDIDLSKTTVGNKQVSEEEFATLAMAIACTPKYSIPSFNALHPDLSTMHGNVMNMGYRKELADTIVGSTSTTMVSIDHFLIAARANHHYTFEPTIQPAREEAADALKAYQQGDKTSLAKYLAEGIINIAKGSSIHQISHTQTQYLGFMKMAGNLGNLLESDPELKQMAMKDYGLKETHLKTLNGMVKLSELDRQAKEAELKLAESAKTGKILSEDEKQKCMNTILKNRIAVANINEQRSKYQDGHVAWQQANAEATKKLPADQHTMFYSGSMCLLFEPLPSIASMANPGTAQKLDQITASIFQTNALADKTEGELLDLLGTSAYEGKGLIRQGGQAMENLKNDLADKGPELQEEVDDPVLKQFMDLDRSNNDDDLQIGGPEA